MKIAFGYKMGSGKDTAVSYLIERFGGRQLSFAKPIYDILCYAQRRCGINPEKDRRFLQLVGTEWGRKGNPNIWINLLLLEASTLIEENCNVYISDLRFLNELKALKENGWFCVKIKREHDETRAGSGEKEHESETELDKASDSEWDYVIENNDTLEKLYQELEEVASMSKCKYTTASS
jgi:hypothetical protein